MRRLLTLVVVGIVLLVPVGAASGQTALSPGCSELNNPIYDETGWSINRVLTLQSYASGEMVTVTFDFDYLNAGNSFPHDAILNLGVGGLFQNPLLTIAPAEDGSLSHVFTGDENGIQWVLSDDFSVAGLVTVECVAAQAPPTTTTTIPEVETDIADSGSAGLVGVGLLIVGLLIVVGTVRSSRQ